MSALPISVWRNQTDPIFYNLAYPSTNVRDIRGGAANFSSIGVAGTFSADTISSSVAYLSSISTTSITLDGNTLDTAGAGFGSELLLNGVPIATTANISSIADWAYEPAVSTINANNNDIIAAKNIGCVNLTATNSVGGVIGAFTTLNSGAITNTNNILTNTLQTTGLINAASISTPSLKANLISSSAGVFSTLIAPIASFGSLSTNTLSSATILAGSITANSGNYSTITVSTINAGSVVAPIDPNPTFTSVTATTGNFTNLSASASANLTGLSVNGTAYINNNTLSNVGAITNSNTTFNCTVDASTNTSVYPTINLRSVYGGGGVVNITADQPSIFVGVPKQQVNVTAKGGVGYVTGIPVGGAISLVAEAGTSNSITPTGILANGAIRLTAYSFINGAFTVPGLILESAGSIAAYSGLTSPSVGVYGCSFYSALTCLSLTCGASPATTSFPGVVYLRGDNGTKVVNGLYTDTLNNNALSDLNIRSKTSPDASNRNINIESGFDLKLSSSNGGQVYINNAVYSPGVSSFTNLFATNASTTSLLVSSINNAAYPPAAGGTVSSFTNLYATNASTTALLVSSINGSAYSPGGSSWVGTATTPLNMNGNGIGDNTGTLMLSTGTVSVYGNSNVLLGVGASPTYTSQVFTSTAIDLYQVGGAGAITTHVAGNLVDIVSGNIQTQATSTINTVAQTIFTGGVSRTLVGSNVQQPIIQYGFASSIGASGTVTVTIPQRYTSQTSYIPFASMIDSPAAQLFVSSITRGSFIIGWTSAGVGNQTFGWQTMGT
jgi:trimeric autotransporter adhesin